VILVLYHRPAFVSDADTITDHIHAFGRYSRHPVVTLNTDGGAPSRLPEHRFEAIVLHYSLFASGPADYLIEPRFIDYLDASDAYKIAFFQDEHIYCRRRFAFLEGHGIDCVYTCLQPEHFEATYRTYSPGVKKLVSHVPAYVSAEMVATADRLRIPDAERSIDIGYRARPTPPYFGRGGMEKMEIGERFAAAAQGRGLALDISTAEEDRHYGEGWYRFTANSRGVLGTESGVSCVDLEDEVRLEYEAAVAAGREPTIEELEAGALGRWDWKVPLRTTSSRHFEAAALRVAQVMYEGEYSGALEAGVHYIALKKDFSNFDQVLAQFQDPAVRAEITENAHRDLIASGAHSYERFIAEFDQVLAEAGIAPPSTAVAPPAGRELGRRPAPLFIARYLNGIAYWLRPRAPRLERAYVVSSKAAYAALRPLIAGLRSLAARVRRA
jgi:hypothetical protein